MQQKQQQAASANKAAPKAAVVPSTPKPALAPTTSKSAVTPSTPKPTLAPTTPKPGAKSAESPKKGATPSTPKTAAAPVVPKPVFSLKAEPITPKPASSPSAGQKRKSDLAGNAAETADPKKKTPEFEYKYVSHLFKIDFLLIFCSSNFLNEKDSSVYWLEKPHNSFYLTFFAPKQA